MQIAIQSNNLIQSNDNLAYKDKLEKVIELLRKNILTDEELSYIKKAIFTYSELESIRKPNQKKNKLKKIIEIKLTMLTYFLGSS